MTTLRRPSPPGYATPAWARMSLGDLPRSGFSDRRRHGVKDRRRKRRSRRHCLARGEGDRKPKKMIDALAKDIEAGLTYVDAVPPARAALHHCGD